MPKRPTAERPTDFAVTNDGVVIAIARTMPPREEPRRVPERIKVGDWATPLPASGHDFVTGRVERAEECAGFDNDQVLIVLPPGGMPYMVKAFEVHKVKPPN